ncbi:MAG: DUF523 domain-containing protein, partial [Bacilli bacterium]|nr:DUF523 domain-containing protein [Bacilli bacterium]
MERCIVSSCLAGIPCRYDCSHKNNPYINELVKEGVAIPLCPEQMAGLPTPREACECILVDDKLRVISKSGKDYTEEFYKGAKLMVDFAKKYNIKKAILQKNSPSCGIKTYDGTFSGTLANYSGITAKMLLDNGIEVISIEDIKEDKIK